MASIKTQFRVGLFVIVGLALTVVTVIWLGMSHHFEKGQYYVAYFDESVQGLDKDSPVKYRGVSIGRVENIGVAPDSTLIEVVMKIEAGLKDWDLLVAQLKSVGITGIMFIELDRKSAGSPDLSPKVGFPSKYPVIETQPSGIKTFMDGIADLLSQLQEFDTKGISDNFKTALDTIDRTIAGAELDKVASDIRSSLDRLEKILDPKKWENVLSSVENAARSFNTLVNNADVTVSGIHRVVSKFDGEFMEIERDLRDSIAAFKQAAENVKEFTAEGSELMIHTDRRFNRLERQLRMSLVNLEKASGNLNRFLERVADQPSSLIFGQEPPPQTFETER